VSAVVALAQARAELVAGNLQRKDPRPVILQLAAHLLFLFGGVALFFFADAWLFRILGLTAMVFGFVGVSTNTHTSAHGATSESTRMNEVLTWFGYSFLCMLSTTYWKHKHNVLHHLHPNVDGIDPDHDFLPLFALTESQKSRLPRLARLVSRAQAVLFPLATLFLVPNMTFIGIKSAIERAKVRRDAHVMFDLAGIALSFLLWFALPLLFISPLEMLLMNGVRWIFSSFLFFAIFAPAHLPHEAPYYEEEAELRNHFERQTATTLNFRAPWLLGFFFSGLQYQIEHHLFPGVSHVRLAALAPKVRQICAEHGLPYRELSWSRAVWKSYLVGARPKPMLRRSIAA
jgi:fatty acid desaturase